MPVIRGVELHISTTADTAGAKQTVSAMDDVKRQTLELATANGLSEASVKQVGEAYDHLAVTFEKLEAQVADGTMTDAEALEKWGAAQKETTEQIKHLGTQSEVTGKKIKETGGHMRVTAERGVMMGNAMAGLVTQFALGADGTHLLAAGMTNVAMIMSTAGPWGIAAGFVLQTLTALALKHKQLEEAAAKAMAKDATGMHQRVEALKEARREQEGWAAAVRETVVALDAEEAALKRRRETEAEDRKDKQEIADRQRSELEEEREDMVKAGTMTPEEKRLSDMADEDMEMFDEHHNKLKDIEDVKDAAEKKRQNALQEEKKLRDEIAQQDERAGAARKVKVSSDVINANAKKISELLNERGSMEGAGPAMGDAVKRKDAEIAALRAESEKERLTMQSLKDTFKDLRPVSKEASDADKARDALKERAPQLFERVADAEQEISKADRAAERENRAFEDQKRKMRRGLKTDEEREQFDKLQESFSDGAGQSAFNDEVREREKRNAREAKGSGGSSDAEVIQNAADKMEEAANRDGAGAAKGLTQMSTTYSQMTKALADAVKHILADQKKLQRDVAEITAKAKATN